MPFCSYWDAEHPPLCTDSRGDLICTEILPLQPQQPHCCLHREEMLFVPFCFYSLLLIVRHISNFLWTKGKVKHRHRVYAYRSWFPNAYRDAECVLGVIQVSQLIRWPKCPLLLTWVGSNVHTSMSLNMLPAHQCSAAGFSLFVPCPKLADHSAVGCSSARISFT